MNAPVAPLAKVPGAHPLVLLAGNPNAGKTTLFNALSGARARVGNYPGVTVDRRVGRATLGGHRVDVADVPGTYSLSARSPEEQVAVDAILGQHGNPSPDVAVVVVDATALTRNLYLALQVRETGVPTVVALNMMDEARRLGLDIDASVLSSRLGCEVVPISAARGENLDGLGVAVERALRSEPSPIELPWDAAVASDVAEVETAVAAHVPTVPDKARAAYARWCLLSVGDDELVGIPVPLRRTTESVQQRASSAGRDLDLELIGTRYAFLDTVVAEAIRTQGSPRRRWTDRIDGFLVHPVFGVLTFAVVMYIVFEALFSWSDPAIGLIEDGVAWTQQLLVASMAAGPFRDLLVEGIVAGVGNVVVFVPQIALLFVFIGFLEDSGYLARVAFVIDRVMRSVGLHGRAFVPLLSGFACAIPAVMATRTIESRRDRLVTMLALPLMSCSARLPVYVLVVATVFAGTSRVGGVFSAGALALFAMYALSVLATLAAAAVMRRTVLRGPRPSLVLELPPYRWPLPRNLLATTWARVRSFLIDAGTIILALTVVLWAALSYPKSDAVEAQMDAARQEARETLSDHALEERLAEIDGQESGAQLRHSALGQVGKAIEPAIEPLGFDWRIGIGILGAFAAREVFVSTLGIVFDIEDADEESDSLRGALQNAEGPHGPLMTPLVGVSLMVFFVLACQCMSTIAVVRRESGSWRWPLLMVAYMSVLAYVASLLVFQVGSFFGWGVG